MLLIYNKFFDGNIVYFFNLVIIFWYFFRCENFVFIIFIFVGKRVEFLVIDIFVILVNFNVFLKLL